MSGRDQSESLVAISRCAHSLPNEEKTGEASAAILVEITQSATVAVPGQPVDDEPVVTGSVTEPSPPTPVSVLDGENSDEDF